MRAFREPTAKNLLREPLVLGVPFVVLIGIAIIALISLSLFGDSNSGGFVISILVGVTYFVARIIQQIARTGWVEPILFIFERRSLLKKLGQIKACLAKWESIEIHPSDTLETSDLLNLKIPLQEQLSLLSENERLTFITEKRSDGFRCESFLTKSESEQISVGLEIHARLSTRPFLYSLHNLPTITTPLWLPEIFLKSEGNFLVISTFHGLKSHSAKSKIETARRRNAQIARISNVDSDVAFSEATSVLEGLARGDDAVLAGSLLIVSKNKLDIDPRYFCEEKKLELPRLSISGIRNRFHRSHLLRAVTCSDLILNIGDPNEQNSVAILKTVRGLPLYFDPQDKRLEALHWLVTGASGSGKSFFVGLVLKRLIQANANISVLFVDHNRSFRRVTNSTGMGDYIEPSSFEQLSNSLPKVIKSLEKTRTMAGVELSDLATHEKKSAIHFLLTEVEKSLRSRETIHPVYLVLDESWNFLRDEPVLVQRTFREFRKLNGATIAITQSLSDYLMDESGRAIFQNAPVRILLRQAEDLEPYRGILGINDVELKKLRALRQKRGEFSECLIKTPYLSRIGRLHPTEEEHELLRTDNIREELVRESKISRQLNQMVREERC